MLKKLCGKPTQRQYMYTTDRRYLFLPLLARSVDVDEAVDRMRADDGAAAMARGRRRARRHRRRRMPSEAPAPPLHGIREGPPSPKRRREARSRVRPSRELLPLVVEEAAERALVESREAQRLAHQVIAVGVGADPAHVHAEIAERAHLRRTTRARGSRARAACSARKRGALARASAPSRCRRRTNRPRRSIPCRPLCAARPGTYTCARASACPATSSSCRGGGSVAGARGGRGVGGGGLEGQGRGPRGETVRERGVLTCCTGSTRCRSRRRGSRRPT